MPELPEVENVRRSLEKCVLGKEIAEIKITLPRMIKNLDAEIFSRELVGKKITAVERRGKYLLILLDDDWHWIVHLRMTGKLLYVPDISVEKPKHTHIVVQFTTGDGMFYNDIRTFGTHYFVKKNDFNMINGLYTLGKEPFDLGFNAVYLEKTVKNSKENMKGFLLNQKNIAGLGNIYVDEVLFASGIAPTRKVNTLTHSEAQALVENIQTILQLSIDNGGTTFRDYVNANGEKGNFQLTLAVYGREGEPCLKCGASLSKTKLGGRGTCCCNICQK
ncbi:MAG: DNA-formamidopyrimidine glycosylase [Clostridia bacterium]